MVIWPKLAEQKENGTYCHRRKSARSRCGANNLPVKIYSLAKLWEGSTMVEVVR